MGSRQKLVRGGLQLLAAHGGTQLLSIARNFCVARLISPEDFGIAVTFALTLSMLEAMSDFSFHRLLIQDHDGDNPLLQSTLHSLMIARGFLIGAMIFFFSGPIAHFFNVPEAELAYAYLALVPIFKSFLHLDIKRVQRDLNFSAEVWVMLTAQITGFIVAIGLAWIWRDYMAVLWALVAQSAVQGVGAHLVSKRRYRLAIGRAEMARALRFGWPLMVNGVILALVSQGDRALVGAQFGMTELAIYAVATMLIGALQYPILKMTGTLALPWIARVKNGALLGRRYRLIGDALAVMSLIAFLPFTLLGMELVSIVFGPEYRGSYALITWLAFGAAIRVVRGAPVTASLAAGDSKNVMFSNLFRSIGVLAAIIVVLLDRGLASVAAAMCVGEFVGYVSAVVRLRRVRNVPFAYSTRTVAVLCCAFLTAMVVTTFLPAAAIWPRTIFTLSLTAFSILVMLHFCPELLSQARILIGGRSKSTL